MSSFVNRWPVSLGPKTRRPCGRSRRPGHGHDDLGARGGEHVIPRPVDVLDVADPVRPGPGPGAVRREGLELRRRIAGHAEEPDLSPALPPRLAQDDAGPGDREGPRQRSGIEVDERPALDDGRRARLESLNGLPVIIGLTEEELVDDVLEVPPSRAEENGDEDGRADHDDGVARGRRPREHPAQDFDGDEERAEREDRQDRVDEAAVEDDVDPEKPELEDGHDHEDRDEQEEEEGEVLGQEGPVHDHEGQLVEGQERPEPGEEADEVPFDLGPVLLGSGVAQGPGELDERGDAGDDDIEPEDMLEGLPQAVGFDRRPDLGDEEGRGHRDRPEDGDGPEQGRPEPGPRRSIAHGEPQEKRQRHRIGDIEEDARQDIQGPPLDAVGRPADRHGRPEAQAEPVEDPGPPVPRPEEENDEPGQEAHAAHQGEGQRE